MQTSIAVDGRRQDSGQRCGVLDQSGRPVTTYRRQLLRVGRVVEGVLVSGPTCSDPLKCIPLLQPGSAVVFVMNVACQPRFSAISFTASLSVNIWSADWTPNFVPRAISSCPDAASVCIAATSTPAAVSSSPIEYTSSACSSTIRLLKMSAPFTRRVHELCVLLHYQTAEDVGSVHSSSTRALRAPPLSDC